MKSYDFRFVIRPAEFSNHFITVAYGRTVYHESCEQLTFAAAKARLRELSAAEPRPHQAQLAMKYRDDRVPPGFNTQKDQTTIHFCGKPD